MPRNNYDKSAIYHTHRIERRKPSKVIANMARGSRLDIFFLDRPNRKTNGFIVKNQNQKLILKTFFGFSNLKIYKIANIIYLSI